MFRDDNPKEQKIRYARNNYGIGLAIILLGLLITLTAAITSLIGYLNEDMKMTIKYVAGGLYLFSIIIIVIGIIICIIRYYKVKNSLK